MKTAPSPLPPPDRGPARHATSSIALLALIAALPYLNTLLNAFVYDDNTQVMNNPFIQSFGHLREIFTTTVWSYVGAQGLTNYYRPMMTLGYLICYQLFGPLAYGFHLANVLLHAAIVGLLFAVTRRLFPQPPVAFVTASLFALHPVHTESVDWIAAVTDLELTLFYLLTFWFFLDLARPAGRRSERALSAMTASFVLALLSKEQALTLPALATLYEHFYRSDRAETTFGQKVSRYGVLWLLAAADLLFRVRFLGAIAPVTQLPGLTWPQAILSAVALAGQYVIKFLWPVHLSAFYGFHLSASPLDARFLRGFLILGALVTLFFFLGRPRGQAATLDDGRRLASFGILWFLGTLAPVLNARWMAANVFAERYLYLPSVGFCWLLAWPAARLWAWAGRAGGQPRAFRARRYRAAFGTGFAILLGLGAVRIVTRNRDWRNDVTLYRRTLAAEPNAYPIRNNLGTVYWREGDAAAAEREWREAVRLAPNNAIILNNLALLLSHQKRYDDAVALYQRAMRLKPKYTDPHLNLGITYRELGQPAAAELQLRVATILSPLNASAHRELAKLYLDEKKTALAREEYETSLRCEPHSAAFDGLGDIELALGERAKAEDAFRHALELNRFDSHARFALGALYAAEGRTASARAQYEAGLETDPRNPEALAALKKLKP